MSIHRFLVKHFCTWTVAVLFLAGLPIVFAQLPTEVAKHGYADTVFVNGKIVSMDDVSTSTNVGHLYQAIAVKGDKIIKLGADDEVRALAGPDTRILDLKGRTMMPGIIEPHTHLYGGATRYMDRFGFKFPPNGIIVEAMADLTLEKTQGIIRDTIKDAVKKVKPGEWVVMEVRPHPGAPKELGLWGMTRRLTNRKTLDLWAPQNPVLMRPGLRGNVNTKALEVLNEFLPGYSASIQETMHGVDIGEDIPTLGWVGSQEMAVITWELFLQKVSPATLAQTLKLASEDLAALGVTTVATRIPFPKVMTGYATLAGLGQMPIRLDAHYEVHRMPTDPQQTRQMYRRTGVLQGVGDDYLWIDGVASERWDSIYPESCTGPDTKAPAHIKAREVCPHEGDLHWDTLSNAIRSGWRIAGIHTCGSESLRGFTRMVDKAIEGTGLTIEDIRQMHFTLEHCNLIGKQPDVIDKLKKYGLILSCGPDYLTESPNWVRDYGPDIERFILPFKTWLQSGVKFVGQHFGGGARGSGGEGSVSQGRIQPPFFMPWLVTVRKHDGKVWQPEERLDRVQALKMYTSWAAEYVRKPEKIGTLEVGKYADLLVVDRDYFTVPEDDMLKVRPLMTMVGGKFVVLQESLARDFGMQPAGPAYNFRDEEVAHIGRPLSELPAAKAAPGEEM